MNFIQVLKNPIYPSSTDPYFLDILQDFVASNASVKFDRTKNLLLYLNKYQAHRYIKL